MEEGLFPGIEELSPETVAALELTAEQTGIAVRRRCCMPELARATVCGWRHRPVTASIEGTLPGLSEQQVRDTYKRALSIWNEACNIGALWTDNLASANVYAHCRKIDGASGTLAWSYLVPCGGSSVNYHLEQRYDNTERWTVDWLLEVILHELGHAWGLDHDTQHKTALMYPYSSGGRILRPTEFEIARVIPMYGPPVVTPPTGPLVIQGGALVVNNGSVVPVSSSGELEYAGKRYKLGATAL